MDRDKISYVLDHYKVELKDIITHFGKDNQKIKAIEELSELQKELCKSFIKDNKNEITEEMADCYIMLRQLMMIYENEDDIEKVIRQKIERTIDSVHKYHLVCVYDEFYKDEHGLFYYCDSTSLSENQLNNICFIDCNDEFRCFTKDKNLAKVLTWDEAIKIKENIFCNVNQVDKHIISIEPQLIREEEKNE